MKTIIISLLLLFTVQAQNVWYVDRDATGSNNGTSWANAWNSLNNVNWSALQGGDTVYVSGGVDSVIYRDGTTGVGVEIFPNRGDANAGITYSSEVIVTRAWQSGHNGKVYIMPYGNDIQWMMSIMNISMVKFYGFNIWDDRTGNSGTMLYIGGYGADNLPYRDSCITFENCHIRGSGLGSMIYLSGYRPTIRNCYIEQPENDLINDQDIFGISGGTGGVTIEGCRILYPNTSMITDAHRDVIQFSNFGMDNNGRRIRNVIRNNVLYQKYDGTSWNAMIYSYRPECMTTFYIYNNIVISENTASPVGGFFISQPDDNPDQWLGVYAINNTMVLNSPPSGTQSTPFAIDGRWIDTIIIKNNVVRYNANINYFLLIRPFSHIEGGNIVYDTYVRQVDYNAYSQPGGISNSTAFYPGERFGGWNLGQWLADGWDNHSLFQNSSAVNFVNGLWDEDPTNYYTTTGRDIGVDITESNPEFAAMFPDIAYDILGNPRTGAWDMGALEFQDGAVDTVPSFSFTALNNQEINTAYIGSATFSGADSTFTVYTTTGARFNINSSGSLSTTPKTAVNGDVVYAETVTGSSYSTGYSETIVAGGVSRSFTVTTKAEPIVSSGNGGVVRGSDGKIWRTSDGKIIKVTQ